MKSTSANANFSGRVCILCAVVSACLYPRRPCLQRSNPRRKRLRMPPPPQQQGPRTFDTPQQAADALVDAAENFDVAALTQIFGPDGNDIVFSGEFAQDRKHAADFAAQARQKKSVSVDPKNGNARISPGG